MSAALECEVSLEPTWRWTNWARVKTCRPRKLFRPETLEEILEIVRLAERDNVKLKVVGSGHSPSDIACTDGYMLSLEKHSKILHVDKEACRVVVQAGVTLETLNQILFDDYGLALTNLGSISAQSIAGAMATGTHGTGIHFGVLASSVVSLSLVTASAQVIEASEQENPDIFFAALCGIGALGIVTTVTFTCVPRFALRSEDTTTSLAAVLASYPAIVAEADHVRFHWFPHTDTVIANKSFRLHDAPCLSSPPPPLSLRQRALQNCLDQSLQALLFASRYATVMIPWINRAWAWLSSSKFPVVRTDRSYRIFNFDCYFSQYVDEWAIPLEDFPAAILELKEWIDRNAYVHFPVEVRFVRRDGIWLSPAYGRDVCFIGVIMYRPYYTPVPYKRYFGAFEQIMMKYGGRPHWAKDFRCPASYMHAVYPKMGRFVELCARLDPRRRFWHSWHARHLDLAPPAEN